MKKMSTEKGRLLFESLRREAHLPTEAPDNQIGFPVMIQTGKPTRRAIAGNDDIRRCRTSDQVKGAYRY